MIDPGRGSPGRMVPVFRTGTGSEIRTTQAAHANVESPGFEISTGFDEKNFEDRDILFIFG